MSHGVLVSRRSVQAANQRGSSSTRSAVGLGVGDSLFNTRAGDSTSLAANMQQWISQLILLMSSAERSSFPGAKALPPSLPSYPSLGVSLPDFVAELQYRLNKLDKKPVSSQAHDRALDGLDTLWEEMRDQGMDTNLERDVKEQVDGMLRGHKLTRSDRRATFKISPYSYKPTSFQSRFVSIPEGKYSEVRELREPSLAPLSDEVSVLRLLRRSVLADCLIPLLPRTRLMRISRLRWSPATTTQATLAAKASSKSADRKALSHLSSVSRVMMDSAVLRADKSATCHSGYFPSLTSHAGHFHPLQPHPFRRSTFWLFLSTCRVPYTSPSCNQISRILCFCVS